MLSAVFSSVFSIVYAYFIVAEQRIATHLSHFKPLIHEYDVVSDSNAYFNCFYFITYFTLNEFDEPTKKLYTDANHDIVDKIIKKEEELMSHLTINLDYLLSLDEAFTTEYKTKVPQFKDHDICELLDANLLKAGTVAECDQILNGIAKLGLPTTVSRVYELFEKILEKVKLSNFAKAKTVEIVNEDVFLELDRMMIYGDLMFTTYMRIIRENLVNILNS